MVKSAGKDAQGTPITTELLEFGRGK